MTAAGAEAAGLERIPCRPAAFEKVLRVVTGAAIPAAPFVWTPFAERATNAAEFLSFARRCGFLSGSRWLQFVLKKPEYYREMQKQEHTFLLRNHSLPSFKGHGPEGV